MINFKTEMSHNISCIILFDIQMSHKTLRQTIANYCHFQLLTICNYSSIRVKIFYATEPKQNTEVNWLLETGPQRNICTLMPTEALFTIAKMGKGTQASING